MTKSLSRSRSCREFSIAQARLVSSTSFRLNSLHIKKNTKPLPLLLACFQHCESIFAPASPGASADLVLTSLQFVYRLSTCPELCFGLFSTNTTSTPSSASADDQPTLASANPPNSSTPERKSVLIAMIIATKTSAPYLTDESLEYPPNWTTQPSSPEETRGHQEHGQTICIHTLGVLPAYQGRGLAKTIMKSYQQRMETSGIAERIALLAHEHLVKMYETLGFVDKGRSPVKFSGGGWTNLVCLS